MDTLIQDSRYALRRLLKSPGFTFIAALTLTLGIGANTAIFSLVNAVLLRPLPVHEPERLVMAAARSAANPNFIPFSYPDYVDYRDRNEVFSGLIASGSISMSLTKDNENELIQGEIVSGNYFDVLGIKPALGRAFTVEEDQTPGTHPVVVLTHGLWKKRFNSDPGVIGQELTLNGNSFTVIGVGPEGFSSTTLGRTNNLWVPMMMQALVRPPSSGLRRSLGGYDLLTSRGPGWLRVVGRLKPDVSLEQAQANVDVIASSLAETYPNTNRNRQVGLVFESQSPGVRTTISPVLWLLMAVVGLVLLIACANVANLLLARASARRKEISIRLALGASRGRLIRQLLTESIMLAALGGLGAALVALWATDLLYSFPIPQGLDLSLDYRVLGFTIAISLLTGIIFGLAPALQASRPDLVPTLKDEAGALAGSHHKSHLRNLLVVLQIAVSLVLLVGAGLFLRSLQMAQAVDPGFDTDNILTLSVNLDLHRYSDEQGALFYQQLQERAEGLPGVRSATLARLVPLTGSSRTSNFVAEGQEPAPDATLPSVNVNVVGLRYFETMGIRVLRGRDFTALDKNGAPRVAIVNETMAARFWPGEEVLGKRFRFGTSGPFHEVVGVAKDTKYQTIREEPLPFVYQPMMQNYESIVTLHVRGAGDTAGLVEAVRREVQALDKNLPVFAVSTLAEQVGLSLSQDRMSAILLGLFGVLALVLAAIGIYGVMANSVTQRTREIGIRMALGAKPSDVLSMIVKEGMMLTLIGIGLGLAAAYGLTRLIAAMLYGVSATDLTTFAGVAILLAVVALAACYIPARRATKVDPMVALRYE